MEYSKNLITPSVRVFSVRKSIEHKVLYQNSILATIPFSIDIETFGITRIDEFLFPSLIEVCKSLLKEADELVGIFISSRKTATLNLNN